MFVFAIKSSKKKNPKNKKTQNNKNPPHKNSVKSSVQ